MISVEDIVVAKRFTNKIIKNYSVKNLDIISEINNLTAQTIISTMVDLGILAEKENFYTYPFLYSTMSTSWVRYKMNYTCISLKNFSNTRKLTQTVINQAGNSNSNFVQNRSEINGFSKHFLLDQVSVMYEILYNMIEEST